MVLVSFDNECLVYTKALIRNFAKTAYWWLKIFSLKLRNGEQYFTSRGRNRKRSCENISLSGYNKYFTLGSSMDAGLSTTMSASSSSISNINFFLFCFLFFLLCIIILFVCFIFCFALLCFYVSLHYVLPALQFICACLIFMNMYVLLVAVCKCIVCFYVIFIYKCMSIQKLIASLCYIVCVLPTLNKTYLLIYLFDFRS